MVKGCKQMLSNIIDRSDGTDHFDRIISNQVIEIYQHKYHTCLALEKL